jgi:hypothetical protein
MTALHALCPLSAKHGFDPNGAQKILDFLHNSPTYGPIFNDSVFDPQNFPRGAPW